MQKKISRAVLTFAKYAAWTAIGAVAQVCVNHLTDWHLPVLVVPVIASFLKALCTFAATKEADAETSLVIDGGKLG